MEHLLTQFKQKYVTNKYIRLNITSILINTLNLTFFFNLNGFLGALILILHETDVFNAGDWLLTCRNLIISNAAKPHTFPRKQLLHIIDFDLE